MERCPHCGQMTWEYEYSRGRRACVSYDCPSRRSPAPAADHRRSSASIGGSRSRSLEETRRLFPDALRAPIATCPDCLGTGFHREWERFTSAACLCIYTTDELLQQLTEAH
jgi:hypothetical protein